MTTLLNKLYPLSTLRLGATTRKELFHTAQILCKKKLPQTTEDVEEMPIFEYASKNQKRQLRLYMWGCAMHGALGKPTLVRPKSKGLRPRSSLHCPTRMTFAHNNDVTGVACGYGFSVFSVNSKDEHKVFGTGLNTDSQIGLHEARLGHHLECLIAPVPIPIPFQNPSSTVVTHVACGRAHTIVATDKEGVFSLGNNAFGQCGRPIIENEKYSGNPLIHQVRGLKNHHIKKIVCGHDHTLFLTEGGEVLTCGLNADGQLGLGHTDNTWNASPVVGDIEGEKIVDLSCFGDTALAISEKGDMFGWGNNEYRQFGMLTEDQQLCRSKYLPFKEIGKVAKVAAGGTTCLVLNDKSEVFVWGYGILGFGPKVLNSENPKKLPETLFGKNEMNPDVFVKDVSCSLDHFAAITNKGDLYMWGVNARCSLGLGNHNEDQYFPLRVSVPAEVLEVHCGVDHTAATCLAFV